MRCSERLLTTATLMSLMSMSCGGSMPPASPTVPSSTATLVSATMSGANVTLASVGQTSQIVVTGTFSDGTTTDITKDTAISSSDPAIATANSNDLVTAWGPGTAVLTAIYQRNPVHPLTSGTITVLSGPASNAGVAPTLISPANGSSLPNGCASGCTEPTWTFSWTRVTGATAYHLLVFAPSASFAAVDAAGITDTTYGSRVNGAVIASNQNGWTWMVQAQVNGVYQAWSVVGTFNVLP